ncbi:MAG: glycoside hydrolase family 3 N-terminal domain-containing protein [Elusimicrobia bacterium]|nr:glycoside hydrolase family 3 N-terminal domain-containing protein [Elusimicrobiota bacterium]
MVKPLNINELSVEQKIGQMLLARSNCIYNPADKKFVFNLIKNRSLGGIHLPSNKKIVSEFLAYADYPILVCDNMENGYRGNNSLQLPCQMAVGATNLEEYAYEFGRLTAIQAKADGLNVVFGPILDIAMNPLSNCVGPRSFGGNKELVAKMAIAAIKGYQDNGMIVTGKHFPGFGESAVDSHIGMVYLNGNRNSLIKRELYPYIKTIKEANLSGVMVGHIMVEKIDKKYPASISPKLIKLLRDVGFDGLVMTDSFAMVGLTNLFSLEKCHELAMAAGNDMVMTSYRIPMKTAYGWMLKAYRNGAISIKQIDNAVRRVIEAQTKTMKQPSQKIITDKDRKTAINMSEASITAVLNGVNSAAIPVNKKHLFILQVGNSFKDPQTQKSYTEDSGTKEFEQLIKESFPNSDIRKVNEFPSQVQIEATLSETMKYDSLVVIPFSRTEGYLGSSDLTQRLIALVSGISPKISAIVLFGNAYAARELPAVKRLIFAYEGENCFESAMKVLRGQIKPHGKLPVPVKLKKI